MLYWLCQPGLPAALGGCMRALSSVCTSTSLALAALLVWGDSPLHAQDPAAAPAHISSVDGSATIDRNGELEPVVVNMPVVEGDRVRTQNGRLEVMFADGSAIDLDRDSEVEFLGAGRVRVVAGAIEHRAASAAYDPARALQPAVPEPLAAAQPVSAQALPSELRPYSSQLDQNGAWQYEAPYGNVWYPTVTADWRPYFYGYWSSVPVYGWTWIGYDPWAWPTHHYGRWGFAHSRWFWIPGRTFAPAWVSWGTAPGYVSWCPLGFDGRAVAALSVGYRPAWHAWTFVPRDRFGWRGYPVPRYAVEPHRIAPTTAFVVHRQAPPATAFTTGRQLANPTPQSAGRHDAGGQRASSRPFATMSQQPPVSRAPGGRSNAPGFASQPQAQRSYRVSSGYGDHRPTVGYGRPASPTPVPAFARQNARAYTRPSSPAFSRQGVPTARLLSPPRASSPPPRAAGDGHSAAGPRPSPHIERGPSRSSSGRAAVKRGR